MAEEILDIIKARVWWKVDTEAGWNANQLILGPGEPAWVTNANGQGVNVKIGDGTKRFSDLSYFIDYAGGQYIEIEGSTLPTPETEVAYSFVGPGTYTYPGQPDLVVDENRWGQPNFANGTWSLKDMGELPTSVADGDFAPGETKGLAGGVAYSSIFDESTVVSDLRSALVNQGKLFPFKNYGNPTQASIMRFRRAILDVVFYVNDSEDNDYVISQVSVNDPASGNRIDIRKKPKDSSAVTDYSFRTIGSSVHNSPDNTKQLNKLASGKIETITLVPNDNSFKVEVISDTSKFNNPDQINMYQALWNAFIFDESVYRKYDTGEIPVIKESVSSLMFNMPNGYEDTGYVLDTSANKWIRKTNGVIETGGSAYIRDFTPVDRTKPYFYTGRISGTQGVGVAFKDSEGTFITQPSDYVFNANGGDKNLIREPIVIPDNAASWAFSAWADFKIESGSMIKASSQQEVNNIQSEVTVLDQRVTNLEESSSSKIAKALNWQNSVSQRENELRGEYLDKKIENPSYEAAIYGVEWDEDVADSDVMTRLRDIALHQSLPLQSKIRSCVMKNGIVQYWLHTDNKNLKEDGVTPSVLDGTDGDVMMRIPEGFFRTRDIPGGKVKELLITEEGVPGFTYVPEFFISAYQATVNRSENKLASVCSVNYTKNTSELFIESSNRYVESDNTGYSLGVQNVVEIDSYTSNAPTFRGNVNDISLDGETNPSSLNYARNNLGRPVANINRKTARQLAENGGGLIQQYDGYKWIFYLMTVEYATRNIRQPIMPNDVNGLRQGGLGKGATVYPDYQYYESYFSPQGGTAAHPNGITNELGDNSGEVYFRLKNVPVRPLNGSNQPVEPVERKDVLVPVNSYRGIEGIYGQLYSIVDNVDVLVTNLTYPLKRNTYAYQPNPYLTNDSDNKDSYKILGSWEFNSSIHVLTNLKWGRDGHILPIGSGSNAASAYQNYYCCAVEHTGAWNGNIQTKWKFEAFAGRFVSDVLVTPLFSVAVIDVNSNRARTSDSVRLQYFGF